MGKTRKHTEFVKRLFPFVEERWPDERGRGARLADVLGIASSHGSAILRGERYPSEAIMHRLTSYFGLPSDYFISTAVLEGPVKGLSRPAKPRTTPNPHHEAFRAGIAAAVKEMESTLQTLREMGGATGSSGTPEKRPKGPRPSRHAGKALDVSDDSHERGVPGKRKETK